MGNATHTFPDGRAARIAGSLLKLHSPHDIAEAVEIMIEVLDLLSGDPDFEETDAEDSFELSPGARQRANTGPGCTVSDPDCAVDDSGCDEDVDLENDDPIIPTYGADQTKEPELWNPGVCHSLMRPHIERIRRTQCERTRWGEWRFRNCRN